MNLPNRLTVGRLLLCGGLVIFLEWDWPGSGAVALFIFVVASLTDWLDGHLARSRGLVTDLGKLLDPLADKVLISVCYIGFVHHDMIPMWIAVSIVAREFLITGLRSLAAAKGVILGAERAGKHKTISQMVTAVLGLILLAAGDLGWFETETGLLHAWVFLPMLYLTLGITIYSGVTYFLKNQRVVVE